MNNLTHHQKAIHFDTWQHIHLVRSIMTTLINDLMQRALMHDIGKMQTPEAEVFAEYTPRLKDVTYGSAEYKACMTEMGEAIKHHQQSNRHHPEYFENGINGMTLVDLVELICDWMAATKRSKDGDIMKSFEINKERFGMSDQLIQILKNTVNAYKVSP